MFLPFFLLSLTSSRLFIFSRFACKFLITKIFTVTGNGLCRLLFQLSCASFNACGHSEVKNIFISRFGESENWSEQFTPGAASSLLSSSNRLSLPIKVIYSYYSLFDPVGLRSSLLCRFHIFNYFSVWDSGPTSILVAAVADPQKSADRSFPGIPPDLRE